LTAKLESGVLTVFAFLRALELLEVLALQLDGQH
jgi:hypothetical protein